MSLPALPLGLPSADLDARCGTDRDGGAPTGDGEPRRGTGPARSTPLAVALAAGGTVAVLVCVRAALSLVAGG